MIPGVSVGPEQSLWLPVSVSLGPEGLCRECTNFAATEHIVYATAELLSIEYENGILAMEFAAPEAGEVILQMARRPVGPFLAAGKPTEFDWDDAHMRARLKIPASKAQGNRVRIGIAIEAPETSAFFNDLHRLVIGSAATWCPPCTRRPMWRGARGCACRRATRRSPRRNRLTKSITKSPCPPTRCTATMPLWRWRRTGSRWDARACNSSAPPISICSRACNFISDRRPN